jgi:endonuclease/exonuclease/phosphatase (EEP) superfamily protein YafD
LEQRIIFGARINYQNNKYKWILNTHFSNIDEFTQYNASIQTINFYQKIKKDFPNDEFYLLGDFNVLPNSRTIKNLELKFIDLWSRCGNGGNGFTFNSRNPTIRIDYIFYERNENVINNCTMNVINSEASDHRKVYLNINFKK